MFKTRLLPILSVFCLLWTLLAGVQAKEVQKLPAQLPDLDGSYAGQLNYIDYRSNKAVAIPMQLHLKTSSDKTMLIADRVYTDPGYQVFSLSVMRYEAKQAKWYDENFEQGNHVSTTYEVLSFDLKNDRDWKLVRSTQGQDNNRAARLTITESLQGRTFRSETRVDYLDTDEDENLRRNWIELTEKSAQTAP
ncbi:MAG: hypothetical protein AAF431_11735 [Pseudomonadota bacterium]